MIDIIMGSILTLSIIWVTYRLFFKKQISNIERVFPIFNYILILLIASITLNLFYIPLRNISRDFWETNVSKREELQIFENLLKELQSDSMRYKADSNMINSTNKLTSIFKFADSTDILLLKRELIMNELRLHGEGALKIVQKYCDEDLKKIGNDNCEIHKKNICKSIQINNLRKDCEEYSSKITTEI